MLYAGLAFGAAALVRALHHVALTSSGGAWVYTVVDLPYAAAWHLGQAPSAAVRAVASLPAAARAAAVIILAGALVAGVALLLHRLRRRDGPG